MKYRPLGKTGMEVSEVSFGTWPIGAQWGNVDDREARAALNKAVDLGVNFFDTADIYGGGRSEKLLAELLRNRSERIFVTTKAGQKLQPQVAEKYTITAISDFVEASLRNLRIDAIDLLQLHSPPFQVYYTPELYEGLDSLVKAGKLINYGVSVEKVEEALKAIEYPGVKAIQIIFNMFRQRPAELFFREAKLRSVGVIARVPLASGLLSGKMNTNTIFQADDHRSFNRNGEAFDKGETFSGVDFLKGLAAVEELKKICPKELTMVQFALQWILMHDAISCVIPGAKKPEQVEDNCSAVEAGSLTQDIMLQVRRIYDKYVRYGVHQRW